MTALTVVLYYVLWTVALVLLYAGPRIPMAAAGKRRMDSWERNQPVLDSAFFQRAKGAHLNCLENLPSFAAVVVIASLMGKSAAVDGLAIYVLYARIAQGVVHMISNSPSMVLVRAGFFALQQVLLVTMVILLLK